MNLLLLCMQDTFIKSSLDMTDSDYLFIFHFFTLHIFKLISSLYRPGAYSGQGSWASLLCITTQKMYYHLPFFNLPSKTGKESFIRQILLSDLRFYTYEWKQTKIWMIFNLKSGGVLILKCVVLFYFNHIM